MGMGDEKVPYKPKYEPIRDDVLGHRFTPCAIRTCPEPHVKQRYGVGGVVHVSIYTCRRCKYVKQYKFHGGVSCGYGLGANLQAGTEGEH